MNILHLEGFQEFLFVVAVMITELQLGVEATGLAQQLLALLLLLQTILAAVLKVLLQEFQGFLILYSDVFFLPQLLCSLLELLQHLFGSH